MLVCCLCAFSDAWVIILVRYVCYGFGILCDGHLFAFVGL